NTKAAILAALQSTPGNRALTVAGFCSQAGQAAGGSGVWAFTPMRLIQEGVPRRISRGCDHERRRIVPVVRAGRPSGGGTGPGRKTPLGRPAAPRPGHATRVLPGTFWRRFRGLCPDLGRGRDDRDERPDGPLRPALPGRRRVADVLAGLAAPPGPADPVRPDRPPGAHLGA